jgi:hypothetical protein
VLCKRVLFGFGNRAVVGDAVEGRFLSASGKGVTIKVLPSGDCLALEDSYYITNGLLRTVFGLINAVLHACRKLSDPISNLLLRYLIPTALNSLPKLPPFEKV